MFSNVAGESIRVPALKYGGYGQTIHLRGRIVFDY